MGVSTLQEQHDVIIDTIKNITRGDWKVLVLDEGSKKILDNVVKEDDILNHNIANIERIEQKRDMNPEMDAIYILSPQENIVEILVNDFERRRYKQAYLVWTGVLDPRVRRMIDGNPATKSRIAGFETLSIDFFPRESHLVTFRDPWSFPILYHPACNNLVARHMKILAQKITGVCVTLGEYPKVRYYRPKNPLHEAAVLSSHLARFVQEELDEYAQWNPNFPPQSTRPAGTLIITDRSMDILAPLVHEFTYQAMAHDLLPIQDGDKVTYHMVTNGGTPEEEEKDMELSDKDPVWVDNRHRHMKDTIEKLMSDFRKFLADNPHFVNENQDTTSLNAIRDMLAGLPQFQEMKEAYSLHLNMAQEAMNIFEKHKLPDIASIEQTLATGLDEDFKKPKNILDQVVRLLDDDAVSPSDRLRLIILYVLYRDGVIMEDINRLLAHSGLPQRDGEVAANLEMLGGRPVRNGLKDVRPPQPPLFQKNTKSAEVSEEYSLSRFETAMQTMLDELSRGTLDQTTFPYVKPPADPNEDLLASQQGSLRAGRPNWAAAGRRPPENRQRYIVFMAGGATYSESRACYEVSSRQGKDIFLVTSHMLTPQLYVRQVGDLGKDKRTLDIPMERPTPRAPAWVYEKPAPPPNPMAQRPAPGMAPPGQPVGGPGRRAPAPGGLPSRPVAPPTAQMGSMSLNTPSPIPNGGGASPAPSDGGKPHKLEKDKKKRNFLGMKKSHKDKDKH
ncbi:Sec1 family protein [Colletotrichum higginsianum]|uniref:Sec1 family protein n=2 Tax=Colletotrichum higginsianum TaxID=80884 RepID=H1V023_COLHI|nr:Sec1 family protein [Colletotrichum higginsianum IMI 349063]OBR12678.1 Sec1 family protein [Colletotrichum higginsianum IMI 349063]TID00287.1 Protein transport protein sec1 [Colletotrichum higginsianum]GJC94348.1 sec1 family protein [Colletotrichum higginsianum]CCF33574.1 Sec1 family protein [Colletotrichum higginsianum]